MTALIRPTGGGKLDQSATAKFDVGGRAVAVVGPVPSRQVWAITRMTIAATGPTNPMPRCYVYEGDEGAGNLLDNTYTGVQNTSDFGTPYELEELDFLTFVWAGGTPGAVATARIVGRRTLS